MTCKCFDKVSKELAKRNTRMLWLVSLGDGGMKSTRPMLATEQIERGRGKPKTAVIGCTFCPFCGEEL